MFRNKPLARWVVAEQMLVRRKVGYSYGQIGEQYGYTASGARRMIKWAERVAGEVARPLHQCKVCGELFEATRGGYGVKFCSGACRQDAYRHRSAERVRAVQTPVQTPTAESGD